MKIHLTGIGGVGMAGLAVLLKRRGYDVSGCDVHASARTRWLASLGIPVAIGHDARHVEGQDLVIVTPAVAKDNPEYLAAIGRGRPPGGPDSFPSVGSALRADRPRCLRRGEVLAKLVSDAPDTIAVCGSHGKTTTATFIAKLLIALGESVEWAIGGETADFPVAGVSANNRIIKNNRIIESGESENHSVIRLFDNSIISPNPVLVVEADESDGTLAEYAAKTLVITNCEYDHPDHFKTREDYIACYDAARAKAGAVVEGRARDARRETRAETRDLRPETSCLPSHVSCPQLSTLNSQLSTLAPHNRQNALMAVEVARRRGHSLEAIAAALPGVVAQLPDRRFQRVWPTGKGARHETRDASRGDGQGARHETRDASRGDGQGARHETRDASGDLRRETRDEVSRLKSDSSRLTSLVSCPLVYTDYAHHPTEMACAVQMARAAAEGRVIVLFQPHRYSRTKALKGAFPAAFAGADEVVLCPTYAAFEKPVEGGDIADLYAACREYFNAETQRRREGPKLFLARSCAEAWEHARNTMKPGDLTLLLGAGDIIDLVPQIRTDMKHLSDEGLTFIRQKNVRRFWIGAGSNTWKSDLKLDVEYVKTEGPAGRAGASLLADPAIGPRIPWMAGIPGTIGGWVKMNAGAFGHSISEVIESVKVDGKWISAAECGFRYRHSDIAGEIQDVKFRVGGEDARRETGDANGRREDARRETGDANGRREDARRETGDANGRRETGDANGRRETGDARDYLARRKKFPPGTKGSVFKNPPGDFAGRLLEAAGAKELSVGGAYVWSEHANVIVAGPDATASDFLALARLMAARVWFRFGTRLEPEVAGLPA